jgi:adenylate kinase
MHVICTGISGTGRLDWLRQVVALARGNNLDVKLYDVTETMFEIGRAVGEPVEEETILDMFPRALVLLRAAALEQICSSIQADPDRDWILNTHAVFRWKNTLISGFDPHYLGRLDPHLFVTVTTGVKTTLARLKSQERWAQLREQDVLTWREEEQFFTEQMARIHRKPQLLLPRSTSPHEGFRALFEPTRTRAYLSYPMQHVPTDKERGLAEFKARLAEDIVVFDPADVNDFLVEDRLDASRTDGSVALASLRDGETRGPRRDPLQQHIADQIVERDYKLIAQSDIVVVFYDVAVPSPGVISEMKFALESGKQVYGVWLPDNEPSVFFTRYCSVWFGSTEALFAHLAERGIAASASANLQTGIEHDSTVAVRQRQALA